MATIRRSIAIAGGIFLIASQLAAAPRPISACERAAVEIAADYLSRGPAAIAERLDASSPFQRFKGQDLLDEIEARLGPPSGARWDLQTVVPALQDKTAVFAISYPSGLDESATLTLVASGSTYKISDIRILAQPSQREAIFSAAPVAVPEQKSSTATKLPIAGAFGVALLGITAAFTRKKAASVSRLMLGGAAAIAVAFAAMAVLQQSAKSEAPTTPVVAAAEQYPARLATLLPLRRSMAEGRGEAGTQSVAACHEATCSKVATLWRAQAELQQMQTDAVQKALSQFAPPSNVPLAEIVRGRAALLKANETESAMAYESAVNLGPGRDGLWYETAQALQSLGFDATAERYWRRLESVGSREADVYYVLAMLAAAKNHDEEASKYLDQAWKMRPAERTDLIAAAPLWSVLRSATIAQSISMSAANEATFASPDASSKAITLPAQAVARISGEFMHIQIGESELRVSGGAALAPAGTPVVDAGTWGREEEERGLRDYQQLTNVARTAAALSQPTLRRRFTRAADALAKRNRWSDLLNLTNGLSPKSEHVPAELFFLRNEALHRMQKNDEAKQLITELAASRVLQRRRDAGSLEHLGEIFAADDLFDLAIAMYDKAQAIHQNPMIDERVRQIQMNRRLATKYSTVKSEHFEIHYPDDVNATTAKMTADIFEAELKRIQKWVPLTKFDPVVVNVVWWDEFRSTYTGSDFILGFYNGKITMPIAGVPFVPPVVGLMSHELCHAMISQASNDQAPRWFQEGLAQRVEMRRYHPNAFNMYEDNRLIAMSLLDAVIGNSPDPDIISEGYIESQTVIRYIESAYGEAGIKKMIEAYRDGATTEEAISKLTGESLADFDTKLRAWGRSGARVFENPEPIRYDRMDTDSIRWSNRNPS